MKLTGIGLGEPEEEPPSPDITIRITLPEDFAGWVMEEVMSRGGITTGMEGHGDIVMITASLAASHLAGFEELVTQFTRGRGKVERAV